MAIGRNDLCPCGSGKKYKKCCMKKNNVIELEQVREERYFQKRNELVDKVHQFLFKKVSLKNRTLLENELAKRLERQIAPEYLAGIFPFWLAFFHTFENGLRGIEWFSQDVERFLVSDEDIRLALEWCKLTPRLIRVIEKRENGTLVEDVHTNEQFFMASNETIPDAPPWAGSFCILEKFQENYFYNGIMFWSSPDQVVKASEMIHSLMDEEKLPYEKVVLDYYPEILASMLHHHIHPEDEIPNKMEETTLLYQINDKKKVMEYFVDHPEYIFDEWKDGDGKLSLTGNWQRYNDELVPCPIYLGEVYGIIQIKKDKLLYNSLFSDRVSEFKEVLEELQQKLIGEEAEILEVPITAEVRNICIRSDQEITPNIAVIAQQRWFLSEIDKPLPIYGNLSLRELVKVGREIEADLWLCEQEYNSYLQIREQFNEVIYTGDFNAIRKELHLPASPFSLDRKTSIESCPSPVKRKRKFTDDEIEILQSLEFTQDMANAYYMQDFLSFYKEKTASKSSSTIQKYRSGLSILSKYIDLSGNESWLEFKDTDWEKLILGHYVKEYSDVSMNQVKIFLSTLKAFVKWIDDEYHTNFGSMVKDILTEHEKEIFAFTHTK